MARKRTSRIHKGDRLKSAMRWAAEWAYKKRYITGEAGGQYEAAPTEEMLYVRVLLHECRRARAERRKPR